MATTIEFKDGPMNSETFTVEGNDVPAQSIIHTIQHPPPNGREVWRYRLSNYETDGTNAHAVYNAPMKLARPAG
jgi:hypothetical protein